MEKKKLYTEFFKGQLMKAIQSEYPETRMEACNIPMIYEREDVVLNPYYDLLRQDIENENFEIDGRVVKTSRRHFVLPKLPKLQFNENILIEQEVLNVDMYGHVILKSRKGKTYATTTHSSMDIDRFHEAIRAFQMGKTVIALVNPNDFKIINFTYEADLFSEYEQPGDDY